MSQYYETQAAYLNYEKMNGELVIYQDGRTGKKNYIARILLSNGKYKTKSLKTNIRTQAIVRAQDVYDDIKLRERRNLPLIDPTVREVLTRWLKKKGQALTKRRQKAITSSYTRCWEPFLLEVCECPLGLDTKVCDIQQVLLHTYSMWRSNPSRHDQVPSHNTMIGEMGNWNVVMRWALKANVTDSNLIVPRATRDASPASRRHVRPAVNTFSEEQIETMKRLLKGPWLNPNSGWSKDNCLVTRGDDGRLEFLKNEKGQVRSKSTSYLGKVNLYAGFFIMLNTGMRTQELLDLKWSDIQLISLGETQRGTPRFVWMCKVLDKKPMRLHKTTVSRRMVVAPERMSTWLQMVKKENPDYCSPDDYILNIEGRRRRSIAYQFDDLRKGEPNDDKSRGNPVMYKNRVIDLFHHEDGTGLTLGHLRSYYVSKMLIDKRISPYVLERQTGHGIQTILQYYLTRRPSHRVLLELGGWKYDDGHDDLSRHDIF